MAASDSKPLFETDTLRLKRTRHGLMLYPVHDRFVGRALDLYGEFSRGETRLFQQIVKPGMVVIDVGAHVGVHTLFFARATLPGGGVVAIEPQPMLHQLLCANLALNEIRNVRAIHAGAGSADGRATVPSVDYSKEGNFGGVPLNHPSGGYPIHVVAIDGFRLAHCHFIKIDVEGMEESVIEGAERTIARCRPVIYAENDRRAKSAGLIRKLLSLDYDIYWHLPYVYDSENFFENGDNVFPNLISRNLLCTPRESKQKVTGMRRVEGPEHWPFAEKPSPDRSPG